MAGVTQLGNGEYIKNWRPRYFVLKSDGSFICYKEKPNDANVVPVSDFSIKNSCQLQKSSKSKPYEIIIRCLHLTTLVERLLAAESADERDAWMTAIQDVAQATREPFPESGDSPSEYTSLDDFDMVKVLYTGTMSKAMLAKEKATRSIVAIKTLKKEALSAEDSDSFMSYMLKPVDEVHPFITKQLGSFQTDRMLCFVMEYVNGGELFFHLSRDKVFSEERTRIYGAEIVSALAYLHKQEVIYNNLQLENLLLDKDGHIKLTDYMMMNNEGQEYSVGDGTTTIYGCQLEYVAPEILEDNEFDHAVDWWGLGVVMYEMVCGRLPFYNRENEVLIELIRSEDVKFPTRVSPVTKSLLTELLEKNPRQRLGGGPRDADDVKGHSFFASVNFQDLEDLKIPLPFIPEVRSEDDIKNFTSPDQA